MRRVFAALGALLVGAAVLASAGLRDRTGRGATGERRIATGAHGAIEYFVLGRGEPVVLLASYARPASDFNELAARLTASGYRTLSVNARGIDGSDLGAWSANYHDFAGDVATLLDTEGVVSPVLLVGHAYGNRIARTFATDHPGRARALALIAAGGETPTPPEVARQIPFIVFSRGFERQRRAAIAFAFFADGNDLPEHWVQGWYPMTGVLQGRAAAAMTPDGWQTGGRAPILLLQPLQDRAAPAPDGGHPLARQWPQRVTYRAIPNAGHAALAEQVEPIAELMLGFFQRETTPASPR